jgi:4'-phosphopantetheinyl transferase
MPPAYNPNPSKSDLILAAADCHIWQIPLSPNYVTLLREAEIKRYLRMTHLEAREDFAASQAGLRSVLGYYVGCAPDAVPLRRQERGKPFLSGGPEFNLSHSAGQVFAAVASQPVGLDIESATRPVDFTGLAAKFFSPAEQDRIAASPPESRNRMFLRHWVCKEATVKLSGDGIFHGLRDVEVFFASDGSVFGTYRDRSVQLREFQPVPGFIAALASWAPLRIQGRFCL